MAEEYPKGCADRYVYPHNTACCYRADIVEMTDDGYTIEWTEGAPEDETDQVEGVKTSYGCGWCLAPYLQGHEIYPFCPGSHVLVLDNKAEENRYLIIGFDRKFYTNPESDPVLKPCIPDNLGFYYNTARYGTPYYTEELEDSITTCVPITPWDEDGITIPRGTETNSGAMITIAKGIGELTAIKSFQVPGFDTLIYYSGCDYAITDVREGKIFSFSITYLLQPVVVDTCSGQGHVSCVPLVEGIFGLGVIIQAKCMSTLETIYLEQDNTEADIGFPCVYSDSMHFVVESGDYSGPYAPFIGMRGVYYASNYLDSSLVRRLNKFCKDDNKIRTICIATENPFLITASVEYDLNDIPSVTFETEEVQGSFTFNYTWDSFQYDSNLDYYYMVSRSASGSAILATNNGKFELSQIVDSYGTVNSGVTSESLFCYYILNSYELGRFLFSYTYNQQSGMIWQQEAFYIIDIDTSNRAAIRVRVIATNSGADVFLEYIKDDVVIILEQYFSTASSGGFSSNLIGSSVFLDERGLTIPSSCTSKSIYPSSVVDVRPYINEHMTLYSQQYQGYYPQPSFDYILNLPVMTLLHSAGTTSTWMTMGGLQSAMDCRQFKISYWYDNVYKTRYFVDNAEYTMAQILDR